MRIEVLIGMIASGKSTYARKRADEGALIISHDALTEMLHGCYRYEEGLRESYRTMEESIAFASLSAGRDIVIDRTHLTDESRRRWIDFKNRYVNLNTFNGI
jgi:predicted kinase